jgi:hypothetical protein
LHLICSLRSDDASAAGGCHSQIWRWKGRGSDVGGRSAVADGGISWRRRCLAAAPWGGSCAGGRGSGRRAGEEGHRAWEEGRRRLLDLVEEEVSWGGGVGRALGAAHQRWEGRDLRRGPPPTGWEGRQRARRDPGGGRGWRERRGRCRGVAGRRGLCGGGGLGFQAYIR